MSNSKNQAKTRWNSKNYKQVKVSVEPEIASSFKIACIKAGYSMASVLSEFMAKYSNTAKKVKTSNDGKFSTRKKRRQAVKFIIGQ